MCSDVVFHENARGHAILHTCDSCDRKYAKEIIATEELYGRFQDLKTWEIFWKAKDFAAQTLTESWLPVLLSSKWQVFVCQFFYREILAEIFEKG